MKSKQFLVVGLGRFGISLARSLYENGHEVMAIDTDADLVESIQDQVTHAAQADACDPEVIRALDVSQFDAAIVTIGTDLKSSAVATMLLKENGVPMVVCKALDEMHGRLLTRLGADRVVYPERDMGRRLAHNLALSNILDAIEVSPDVSMVEVQPLKEWLNRSLLELNLTRRYGIQVVAIRNEEGLNASVRAETVIRPDDVLLIVCSYETLARFELEAVRR